MILIASDSHKEFASSLQVGKYIEKGIKAKSKKSIKLISISDGGEGFLDTSSSALDAKIKQIFVNDPLGKKTLARYAIKDHLGIIEMSEASGINKFPTGERHFLKSSSYGTGELILELIRQGCKKILLGLGGAATSDGGIGAASALGVNFKFKNNFYTSNTKNLSALHLPTIDSFSTDNIPNYYKSIDLIVASDVLNPATGLNGATINFGPQKGGTEQDISNIEFAMCNYLKLIEKKIGKSINLPGTGAAGGIAISLFPLFNVILKQGIEVVMELLALEELIKSSELVVTGEGKLDKLSLMGKAPVKIASLCKKLNTKVIGVFGQISDDLDISKTDFDLVIDASENQSSDLKSVNFQKRIGPSRLHAAGIKVGSYAESISK